MVEATEDVERSALRAGKWNQPPPARKGGAGASAEMTDAEVVQSELVERGLAEGDSASPSLKKRVTLMRSETAGSSFSRVSTVAAGALATAVAPGMEKTPRRAKFEVLETGRKAEVLFMPGGVRLPPAAVVELATKTWKLPMPNLMVMCDAGAVHPTEFVSADLADLPAFESLLAQAKQQVDASAARDQNSKWAEQYKADGMPVPEPTQQEREARALNIVNHLLWTKLVTIFTSVIDSAALSNNWIVIDRTQSMSAAAELALEAALAASQQRPVVR